MSTELRPCAVLLVGGTAGVVDGGSATYASTMIQAPMIAAPFAFEQGASTRDEEPVA